MLVYAVRDADGDVLRDRRQPFTGGRVSRRASGRATRRDRSGHRGLQIGRLGRADFLPVDQGASPLIEIRTGGFRTYCVVRRKVVWVLHVGRKQTELRDVDTASVRMKHVIGGEGR